MKTLNQRLYEEVLKPMLGNEIHMLPEGEIYYSSGNSRVEFIYLNQRLSLDFVFWLAEKVGLFDDQAINLRKMRKDLKSKETDTWVVLKNYDGIMFAHEGKTPQEAIINAILEIYGKKNNQETP